MNWLHYLLEANLYLGVFYIAYCLFLNKETHYLLNRIYLVCSCVIAFVLPVLQLGILIPPPPPMPPATYMAVQATGMPIAAAAAPVVQHHFNWQDALCYVYLAGAMIFLILFIIKLFSLVKLIIGKPMLKHADYNLINIEETNTAFSFFNYLFIGNNAPDKNIIIRHELVHIQQKHSADIIFLEILKVINWFNPLVYLIQNSLKTVHEYIADEKSVDNKDDALAYSSFLVNNAYGLSGPSIAHSFFTYNLLKKRIIMLNQQRSGNLARLKHLVAVPIGAGLLFASTLSFSKTYGWIDLAPRKNVVINPQPYREAPPIVMEGPYTGFYNHMHNNIHFPASLKNQRLGVVITASFELDNKGLIKNVSTDNSKSHPEISNNVVKAIESYKQPINDKLNGKRFIVINFSAKNSPEPPPVNSKIGQAPGYLGSYLITDEPTAKLDIIKFPPPRLIPDKQVPPKPKIDIVTFPPRVPADFEPEKVSITNKGYKVEEGKFTPSDGKTYYVAIISNPSGKKMEYANDATRKKFVAFKNFSNKQGEKMLYEKYGYKFPDVVVSFFSPPPPPEPPKPKIDQVRFPPPIVKPDKSKFHVVDDEFIKYLAKYTRYPVEARESNTRGHVIAEFKVDDTHQLIDPRIVSGIGHGCDEEALRALKAYTGKTYVNKGTYNMVITFDLAYDNDTDHFPPLEPVSNSIKTASNYAGEVFIVSYIVHK